MDTKPTENKCCIKCSKNKIIAEFLKNRNTCKECNNDKRRLRYKNDEEHRKNLIIQVTEYKHNKVLERRKVKELEIGIGNKKCNYCDGIKEIIHFRHNRLKCKDCERDEPLEKFKRSVRSRIHTCLLSKTKHTVEYLGCSSNEYLKWLLTNNSGFTLSNRGSKWHIDHVIPLSKFNLELESEQLVAFNWRNTMPLSPEENLSKNNKIIIPQIEQHYKNLVDYHIKNNIEMPQTFIDLFATRPNCGNPLRAFITTSDGNISKELG